MPARRGRFAPVRAGGWRWLPFARVQCCAIQGLSTSDALSDAGCLISKMKCPSCRLRL